MLFNILLFYIMILLFTYLHEYFFKVRNNKTILCNIFLYFYFSLEKKNEEIRT